MEPTSSHRDLLGGLPVALKASERMSERLAAWADQEQVVQRLSFREYAHRLRPGLEWDRLHDVYASVIERLVAGELRRVIVSVPTGASKTEFFSRLGSSYALRVHGHKSVGVGACEMSLALDISDESRRYYAESGGYLRPGAKSKRSWKTALGGGLVAAGVGARWVGAHADLLILEDPIKDLEQAMSAKWREKLRSWWQSVWLYRLKPGGALIVVSTRWPYGDLIEWLFEREYDPSTRQGWHYVVFDGIRSDEPYDVPPSVTVEPDWREVGEPLLERQEGEASSIRFTRREWAQRVDGNLPWSMSAIQQRPQKIRKEGRVASEYDPAIHVSPGPLELYDGPICVGMDFNVDPMAAEVFQWVNNVKRTLRNYEIPGGSDTREMCELIEDDWGHPAGEDRPRSIICYPDPTGRSRSTSGASDHEIIRGYGWEIRARPRPPLQRMRVAAVNRLLKRGGWIIDPSCQPIRRALTELTWRGDSIDKGRGLDHIFDASTYPIEFEFPVIRHETRALDRAMV